MVAYRRTPRGQTRLGAIGPPQRIDYFESAVSLAMMSALERTADTGQTSRRVSNMPKGNKRNVSQGKQGS
jgi:hypothetical protein